MMITRERERKIPKSAALKTTSSFGVLPRMGVFGTIGGAYDEFIMNEKPSLVIVHLYTLPNMSWPFYFFFIVIAFRFREQIIGNTNRSLKNSSSGSCVIA